MKVVILAGGKGLRLTEETRTMPKALVEIGGIPIIWHIMKYYSHFEYSDFLVALGYKGNMIKKYFIDSCYLNSNIKVEFRKDSPNIITEDFLNWKVELIDTGIETLTGGRIKKLQSYVGDETFMLSWCDTLSDININKLLAFHRSHGKLATLSAVIPPARFGNLDLEEDRVKVFVEKQHLQKTWINGAFFVLEPEVMDYIEGDNCSWEYNCLTKLAQDGQLMAYRHEGFWQCMDTIHEKNLLNDIYINGVAPWKMI